MRLLLPTLALGLSMSSWVLAQALTAPFALGDPEVIENGRQAFNRHCDGRCHGVDGVQGMDGPKLNGKDYLTPEFVYVTITGGRPGTAMPSWKDRLSVDELWRISAYVASLQKRPGAK